MQCTTFLVLIPSSCPDDSMASAIENTTNVDAKFLKRLSRMYETGISLKDISEELRIDEKKVKMFLKLLGYASAD
ncbi:MAG TPA: hypothetical protein VJZ68_08505 [Nitrososphaera sp.]|nr:hypothetical protein [Nitrososphaera sp.]